MGQLNYFYTKAFTAGVIKNSVVNPLTVYVAITSAKAYLLLVASLHNLNKFDE